jgi:hypothetical protein
MLASGTALWPNQASAFSYYAEYMTDWSGCDTSASGLSQTDDQVNGFASVMDSHGHTRIGLWGNQDVWATDVVDSWYGGTDYAEADRAQIYMLSSHGSAPTVGGSQHFQTPFCKKNGLADAWFDATTQGVWGGGGNPYLMGNNLRWALLATCYSVDVHPDQQWGHVFNTGGYNGFEYIMGYRGTSADSYTTDEVPGDWANSCIVGGSTFKSGWFSAAEDWWVDDTAEVMSGGTSASDAQNRRDNLTHSWPQRSMTTGWTQFYWSWHQG